MWDYVILVWACMADLPWHMIIMKGVVSSLTASAIFLIILFSLRPQIKIGKHIAFDGERYILKIVNHSWFRVYNVNAELIQKSTYQVPGGTNTKNNDVKLTKLKRLSISPSPFLFWNRDNYASYAVLYSTTEDLRKMYKDGYFLEFTIEAKHGLSSFTKIKTEPYNHESSILDGVFKHGKKIEVK